MKWVDRIIAWLAGDKFKPAPPVDNSRLFWRLENLRLKEQMKINQEMWEGTRCWRCGVWFNAAKECGCTTDKLTVRQ
jgi:hypothetical protein